MPVTRKAYWAAYHRRRYQTDAEHRERKRAQAREYYERKKRLQAELTKKGEARP